MSANYLRIFFTSLVVLLFIIYSLFPPDPKLTILRDIKPATVTLPDGQIEYFKFGTGTPIVMISGYGVNVMSWDRRLLAYLASQHTVIVFNNRNVGDSLIRSKAYTSQDLANDAYAVIKSLHLQKTAVLGISMGGMIAQQLAAEHPEVVSHLILINTAISGSNSILPADKVKEALFAPPKNKIILFVKALHLFFPPGWRLRMALALLKDHFSPPHHYEKQITPAVLIDQQTLLLGWEKDEATALLIAKLPMPVLVLNGGADTVIPPINSEILSTTIPHATLVRWKEGGHAMIYQYPKEIAAAVNDFLGKALKK